MMGWDLEHAHSSIQRQPVSFGDYVTASVYWPTKAATSDTLPVVIWLHPYAYATGHVAAYGTASVPEELVAAGFVVLSYDQVRWMRHYTYPKMFVRQSDLLCG